ncbi:MAG: hypothetical protein ACR2PX_05155 [Endozoicomonas sp.]|uniref:hypothetical protein n=1 Tax=Endozoicomonas sp. TaxID=1892382 RepID=UPI003D9B5891
MKNTLNANIKITEDADEIPLDINLKDENHFLKAEVDNSRGDIYLSFSSRIAMYDFARSLLHASVYGKSESIEFYPLISGHKRYIVDGVRLSENSSRIFIHCPVENK